MYDCTVCIQQNASKTSFSSTSCHLKPLIRNCVCRLLRWTISLYLPDPHVGRLRAGACTHTGEQTFTVVTLTFIQTSIRAARLRVKRKSSVIVDCFPHLKQNMWFMINRIIIIIIRVPEDRKLLQTPSRCWGGSEGKVDERSVVLPLILWTPLNEWRSQVDELLKQTGSILLKSPADTT